MCTVRCLGQAGVTLGKLLRVYFAFLMTMSVYFEAGSCSNVNDFNNINQFLTANLLSKEEGKDQKSIQSNTTHHTGHHMGK